MNKLHVKLAYYYRKLSVCLFGSWWQRHSCIKYSIISMYRYFFKGWCSFYQHRNTYSYYDVYFLISHKLLKLNVASFWFKILLMILSFNIMTNWIWILPHYLFLNDKTSCDVTLWKNCWVILFYVCEIILIYSIGDATKSLYQKFTHVLIVLSNHFHSVILFILFSEWRLSIKFGSRFTEAWEDVTISYCGTAMYIKIDL